MEIIIEEIQNSDDLAAMFEVWKQVFERELGITLPQDSAPGDISHWLARWKQSGEAVGTLSVVDTSGQYELHDSLGLGFARQARVARFTHLAVLKPFRGMNIPLAMMLEAHRRVIVPGKFDHTWLLFEVEKAARSFLARQLGFTLLPQTFVSHYGCRCPLVRHERSHEAARAIRKAESYLKRSNVEAARVPLALSA
jgi:GNAT superfamily N-acetyltransferase